MEDGFILINTFDGSAKVKNAKRDRRVALSITDMYNTYNIFNKSQGSRYTPDGADAHLQMQKLAKKYQVLVSITIEIQSIKK